MNRIITGDIMRFAAHYRGPKFHAVLCDPPYELNFMGRSWDSRGVSFNPDTWSAIRSLLHPGAHLLAFGGTRTFHRIAVAIEDAGFEIRDTIGWVYASGFPKSNDISKTIDRQAGAQRQVIGPNSKIARNKAGGSSLRMSVAGMPSSADITIPATEAARAWQGYGTALKPAWEPVILARNPIIGTVAENAMRFGSGPINIDGSRIDASDDPDYFSVSKGIGTGRGNTSANVSFGGGIVARPHELGRWPANIIHDGSDEVIDIMGDAQRFFYCAKAGTNERSEGLDGFPLKLPVGGADKWTEQDRRKGEGVTASARANHHPTVKPLALTEYLARLIVPASVVTDRRIMIPFAGSGSECIGAMLAGWDTIVGVEREPEYAEIARARLAHWSAKRS